jgi:predicted DNA-binding protein (MmcQ/YjbR family)
MDARAIALQSLIETKPGATATPVLAPRGAAPLSLMYKVMGKLFAILGARDEAFVIVKGDPHLIEILREQYAGIGHRSHLDRRYWMSIALDADVPPDEVERLVAQSYDLVRASLTRKQRAELTKPS